RAPPRSVLRARRTTHRNRKRTRVVAYRRTRSTAPRARGRAARRIQAEPAAEGSENGRADLVARHSEQVRAGFARARGILAGSHVVARRRARCRSAGGPRRGSFGHTPGRFARASTSGALGEAACFHLARAAG